MSPLIWGVEEALQGWDESVVVGLDIWIICEASLLFIFQHTYQMLGEGYEQSVTHWITHSCIKKKKNIVPEHSDCQK